MVETVSNVFGFIGGLGMFLYGMNKMADGMQKSAGGRMQKFMGMLTDNRVMGIAMGALITAIIQSSGATTVMVVGFVSAGIMTLTQAIGVIMGANIGTTITAWVVSMSQIGDSAKLASPEFYAPLLIGSGSLILMFSSSERKKVAGEILIGLGFLFTGLKFMSLSIKPYTGLPIFSDAFRILGNNPLLGVLVGCLVTALLQSSSASVGILQTLAFNGVVTTNAAIYITLGQNIGSCVTALISSIGASRTAKRAAVMHLSFNIIGAIIFGIGGFIFFAFNPIFAQSNINSIQISIFHTFFNLINTTLLFPFADKLVKLSGWIVKGGDEEKAKTEAEGEGEYLVTLKHLDTRIFETPAFAIETGVLEILHMADIVRGNLRLAIDMILKGEDHEVDKVFTAEKIIDKMQAVLTEYLIKVDNLSLSEEQKLLLNHLFYSVSDIERIGDHVENLAENIQYIKNKGIKISESGIEDLKKISENAFTAFELAIDARKTGNLESVRKVAQLEDLVDSLEDELSEKHIERLSAGKCTPEAGMVFIDILSNLERISDHAMNLAGYVKKEI